VWIALILPLVFGAASSQAQEEPGPPYTVTDANGETVTITDLSRIITIGGAVTEVVYELGLDENIIAVDESSIYPPQALDNPIIGYLRFLSAEPILAYNPTLIITTEDAGPLETLQQLEGAGVTVLIVPAEDTLAGAEEKILTIATALGKETEGESIITEMRADIEQAQMLTATIEDRPRVMIVFAGSSIATGVFGINSGANNMLNLVNAENAVQQTQNYIPMSSEAIVAAAPDVILTTTLSVERVGGFASFLELPGISLTPAAQNQRIVYEGMDELYLFGFTPRLGEAILDLAYLLHEDLPRPVSAVIRLEPDLEQFQQALLAGGVESTLSTDTEFTVFAPTNDALPADFDAPAQALRYHIVEGTYTTDDLRELDGQSLTTLSGESLGITVQDGVLQINDQATIILADQAGENGVVHVIDAELVPVD